MAQATIVAKLISGEVPAAATELNIILVGEDGEPVDVGGGSAYVLPAATTGALGGVKMAAHVADAAGETVTATEFNGLLDALEAAGIVSAS